MKLKQLSAAILATTAITSVAYAGDVTVYGKGNITVNHYDLEDNNGDAVKENVELESNASRLGVKGSLDITDSVKAIYKMEYEVFIDDGDDGDGTDSEFKQRNIYLGLQGDLGTIIAGKHDTPTKLAQGKVDKFNDMPLGDIKNVFEGENRTSNIAMYTSPSLAGFKVTAAGVFGEDDSIGSGSGNSAEDGISLAVSYSNDMLYVALAADDDIDDRELIRLVTEAKFGLFKVGLMVQEAEKAVGDDENDESGFLLSGEFKLTDSIVLKAQYAQNENEDYIDATDTDLDYDVTQIAFGADYKLSDKSKVFAYYANIERDEDDGETSDDTTFAVGYEVKF